VLDRKHLLTKTAFLGKLPGVRRQSLSASRMAVSYGLTMKQVWVNLSAWALMAVTTLEWLWPMFITPMPPPKSM
jgi:hypothetical protein